MKKDVRDKLESLESGGIFECEGAFVEHEVEGGLEMSDVRGCMIQK